MRTLFLLFLLPSMLHAQPKSGGWLRDYSQALAEAKKSNKPLLVVFRCDPCDDTAAFDGEVMRLGGDLMEKFVRVKLTRITGVDLNLFEFDYDCTWYAMILDSNERILGRFGGRDASGPTTYLQIPALKHSLEASLERTKVKSDAPKRPEPQRVEDFPAFKRQKGNNCIHCHQAKIFAWDVTRRNNTFKREEYYVYPTPEKIGLKVKAETGDIVESVLPESESKRLGLQTGDRLVSIHELPVSSYADLTFALHKAPQEGEVLIRWSRDGKESEGKLKLISGWKRTDLSWRPSMFEFIPKLQLSGDDLDEPEKTKLGLPEKMFAMRHDKFVHSTLKKIGVQENDVLYRLDGQSVPGTIKEIQNYVKRNYLSGDRLKIDLLRDGKKVQVELELK
jgi:hypothetical protein